MSPIQIEGTLLWDLYQVEGDPIIADIIPRGPGEQPIYDLKLQQALAKILIQNRNDPVQVRITIEVIPA